MIKVKIDSVIDLPDGYTPNLNNKWELLEAGLVKQKEKKPVLFYVRQTAWIAALLLLFGGVGLFLIKQVQTTPATKPTSSFNVTKQTDKKEVGKLQVVKQAIITPDSKRDLHTKPGVVKKNMVLESKEIIEEPLIVFIDSPKVLQIVAVEQVTAKAKRFVEIDFNEPIVSAKTSMENVVASQKFKFKIGFSAQSNAASNTPNKGSGIGLIKQIN
ncbi:MAG: hypothetical protein V4643_04255 [Bacteroidota bacterium]